MQENCEKMENAVQIMQTVKPGTNIRLAGEDIKAGSTLLSAGHRLLVQDMGLLASTGLNEVKVKRKLKIALMTTGDELVKPGTKLAPGQIYNSNFYSITALLHQLNVQVLDVGVIADNLESTEKALQEAAAAADCIISTGGVSVGDEDYVKAAVENHGQLKLWKLAIKPGKPLACGAVADTPFFGLPGNPVSAFVTFCLVVRPCLLTMLGCDNVLPKQYSVAAAFAGRDDPGGFGNRAFRHRGTIAVAAEKCLAPAHAASVARRETRSLATFRADISRALRRVVAGEPG